MSIICSYLLKLSEDSGLASIGISLSSYGVRKVFVLLMTTGSIVTGLLSSAEGEIISS